MSREETSFSMWRPMGPALRMMLMLTLITGIAYPLIMTGVCQMLFPAQANGSLVKVGGAVAGSRLIGQRFTAPWYFHGRPSASGDNPEQSGGSNLGPTSRVLSNRVGAAVAAFRRQNPTFQGPVPADIVTESGSGLDPDISPAAAVAQVGRVAAARGAPPGQVLALVRRWTAPPQLGFLGEARVNVLELNLALDRQFGRASRPASAALGQKP